MANFPATLSWIACNLPSRKGKRFVHCEECSEQTGLPDFIASQFIHDEELPVFLKRRQQEGMTILPISTNVWLADYQQPSTRT
jgi:hypothetical protein